ncbi:MAG: DUF2207 domain-containing protein, partial [Candidatus Micrarchaeota archaeon]
PQLFEQNNEGWHELVLQSNFQDEQVNAIFQYRIKGEILAQQDTAQFFYKLWGDQWEKSVGILTARIHLPPSFSGYDYGIFLHPPDLNYEVNSSDSTIYITSQNHPAKTYLEANLLLPKEAFSPGALPQAQNYMPKEQIETGEKKYISDFIQDKKLMQLIVLLPLIITLLSYIILYFLFGREIPLSSTGYNAIYEREPPEGISPALAGYMVEKHQHTAQISAEILNLINLGYISATQKEVEKGLPFLKEKKKSVFLKLTYKSPQGLKAHQKLLLDFLNKVQNYCNGVQDGTVYFSQLFGQPKKENAKQENEGFETEKISEYIRSSGSQFPTKFFSIVSKDFKPYLDTKANKFMYLISFAMLFAVSAIDTATHASAPALFGIAGAWAIISYVFLFASTFFFALKPQILGRWTKEGRVLEQKCLNFKKYLEHFGSFGQKDVQQIKLWEQYLVYATAFGIAHEVLSQIEKVYPQIKDDNRYIIYAAIYLPLSSSNFYASASGASGHSSGGFGGGFGGGGGGGGAR